ncbi:uncharacterized protein [Dermacentor albipictus]|uniref:uncharacterized protein n=1 Tax=Dermacentor albipictus TaxID=60249 RepID=UPI0038FD14FD
MDVDEGGLLDVPLPLSTIFNHVGDGVRCLVEGDEVVAAGHIIECSAVASTCCSDGPVHVIAFVLQWSALSKDPHRVDLKLTDETEIAELNRTCLAGTSHKCKHCIAVLLHINKVRQLTLLSSTDLPQSWGQNAKYTVKQKYGPTPITELPCCPKFQEPAVSRLQEGVPKRLMRGLPYACSAEMHVTKKPRRAGRGGRSASPRIYRRLEARFPRTWRTVSLSPHLPQVGGSFSVSAVHAVLCKDLG